MAVKFKIVAFWFKTWCSLMDGCHLNHADW